MRVLVEISSGLARMLIIVEISSRVLHVNIQEAFYAKRKLFLCQNTEQLSINLCNIKFESVAICVYLHYKCGYVDSHLKGGYSS